LEYDGVMDTECVALCDAINQLPDIQTTSSCCGHGRDRYLISVHTTRIAALAPLLYWLDACHTGRRGWHVEARTDCSMCYPYFIVFGPTGSQAYDDAEHIAGHIREYCNTPP